MTGLLIALRLVAMAALMLPFCALVFVLGAVGTLSLRFLRFVLETGILLYGQPPGQGVIDWMTWMQGRCPRCNHEAPPP